MTTLNNSEDIYDLLVNEINKEVPKKENIHTGPLLHDLFMQNDNLPITPHIFLKPSKIKPYIGRRKWLTPTTKKLLQQTSSINLLTGHLRNSLVDLPKHFVDKPVDDSIIEQGTVEQIPIHNRHSYIEHKMRVQPATISKPPLVLALVESFMDIVEDLATTHYYENNYYGNTGFYYNMLYDTTTSIKRFYNNAVALYQNMFGESNEKPQKRRVNKKRFMKILIKRLASYYRQVRSTPNRESSTKESTNYGEYSFLGLSIMIHDLYYKSKLARKKHNKQICPNLQPVSILAQSFTLEQVTQFLEKLYQRSNTVEALMSQIPTNLRYMYHVREMQQSMKKNLIDKIIERATQGKERIKGPIKDYIENIRPELEHKTLYLWYINVIARCETSVERRWMKKMLIAHHYSSLLREIILYLRTNVPDKMRYLTIVDKHIFCGIWMERCYARDHILASRVILKLLAK
jgi:hypothetical protein